MNPGTCSIKADFLEHQGRRLFYLLLQPTMVKARGSVLFLPPFADEMHKSRHIVASQARALAAAGYTVMLLDLTGCGDSSGDFADASWQIWLEDATFAARTLVNMSGGPRVLWGLRFGALLACQLSQGLSDMDRLVLWQPTLNGEQQVDQFLRLRTAVAVAGSPDRNTLWNELRAGRCVDIAGYTLSPALALEMAKVRLNDFNPGCPVNWFELGISPNGSLSVASDKVITRWRERGVRVDTGYLPGEPFWRTVDALINLFLQSRTLDILVQQ